MSVRKLDIKYRCMRPSCCVNCREGYLTMGEEFFKELSAASEEEGVFKSPRGACKLGFSQQYKIVSVEVAGEENTADEPQVSASEKSIGGPIAILVNEHKEIFKIIEAVEDEVRRRDVEGLWISTNGLENAILKHSAMKEEEVLFPAMRGLVTFGEGLVSTIKEDHREILSLLHNVRDALRDNDILDGIVKSMIVSLKGHIRKEDAEFFELVNGSLDPAVKDKILDGMNRIDKIYVHVEAGDRKANPLSRAERANLDDAIAAVRELAHIDAGCCNG